MSGVVETLLKKWEGGALKKANKVNEAWREALPEKELKKTRPVAIKKSVLTVLVENSSWLYSLTLRKRKILKDFNDNYDSRKKIKDIRFRIGELDG